jgi:hypothetical protein
MTLAQKSFAAMFVVSLSVFFASVANACSLIAFDDDGRYVGGDLVSQIAAKADTIQIVRVAARHILRRTYSKGDWYLQFGNLDTPKNEPEFVDEYAFELSVVETLRAKTPARAGYYENHPRIRGYDATELLEASSNGRTVRPPPNQLPVWAFDHPGHDRMVFIGASESAGLGLGECSSPYFLSLGQKLVALRDSMGRLYPMIGAFPLTIDAEFRQNQRKVRVPFNMQSLVPIDGANDIFLLKLRQALSHQAR